MPENLFDLNTDNTLPFFKYIHFRESSNNHRVYTTFLCCLEQIQVPKQELWGIRQQFMGPFARITRCQQL